MTAGYESLVVVTEPGELSLQAAQRGGSEVISVNEAYLAWLEIVWELWMCTTIAQSLMIIDRPAQRGLSGVAAPAATIPLLGSGPGSAPSID